MFVLLFLFGTNVSIWNYRHVNIYIYIIRKSKNSVSIVRKLNSLWLPNISGPVPNYTKLSEWPFRKNRQVDAVWGNYLEVYFSYAAG